MSAPRAQFVPLFDRVLVRPEKKAEERSAGGILIPDVGKERPRRGEVLAVGPGRVIDGRLVATQVRPGQRVVFGKYSGGDLKLGGEDLLVMREDEILGIEREWREDPGAGARAPGSPPLAALGIRAEILPLCGKFISSGLEVGPDELCNRPAGHEGACFRHEPDVRPAAAHVPEYAMHDESAIGGPEAGLIKSRNPAPDCDGTE